MDLNDFFTQARMGIYGLGGIEVFKKDGVMAARPRDASPEAKKRAEAHNYAMAQQAKVKASDDPGDWAWGG